MAAEIVITTDKGVIDLFQGAETRFYVTRQIHDLHNFQTRNADFSKDLEVPPTPNNLTILGVEQNNPSQQGIPCSVQMAGLMVMPVGFLFFTGSTVKNDETTLSIQILSGNFNFINSIAASTIDTINWADLAKEWIPNTLRQFSDNPLGNFVFPMSDWAASGSRPVASPNILDVNHTGYFMMCKEIMTRIITDAGFTIAFAANLPADFSAIALACPVTKFLSLANRAAVSVSQFVENTLDQSVQNVSERIIFQDDDNTSLWFQTNGGQWQILIAEDYTLEITGTYQQIVQGVRPSSEIRIVRNGTTMATFFIADNQPAGTPFFLSATVTAINGDVIYAEIQSFVTQAIAAVELGTTFKISTPGSDADRLVQPAQFMPKIDRKTFFVSMLNVFNLVMQTDDITRVVTINRFNDVFDGAEQDLTNLIDVGGTVEITPGIDSIARNSRFTWENDNLLRNDFNLTVAFDNDILSPDKVVIALPYSAADNSLNFVTAGTVNLKVRCPMYETETEFIEAGAVTFTTINLGADPSFFVLSEDVDFQIGDWLEFLSNKYRIISKSSDRAGAMRGPLIAGVIGTELKAIHRYTAQSQTPRLAIIEVDGSLNELGLSQGRDVQDNSFAINSYTATWFARMKWEELAVDYYADILNALQTPQVIKATFNLDIFTFIQLDHLRPVYIDQFNAFFYINKIEQFKVNNKTRMELIRISTLTTQGILGGFSTGFNEGFKT